MGKPTDAERTAKDKQIKAEKRKLNALLDDLPEDRKRAAEGLIDECAFMRVTLKDYREVISSEGLIDVMPQGKYEIKREHPAVRSYCTMIQKYSSALRQLIDLLPNKPEVPDDYDFENFRRMKNEVTGEGSK